MFLFRIIRLQLGSETHVNLCYFELLLGDAYTLAELIIEFAILEYRGGQRSFRSPLKLGNWPAQIGNTPTFAAHSCPLIRQNCCRRCVKPYLRRFLCRRRTGGAGPPPAGTGPATLRGPNGWGLLGKAIPLRATQIYHPYQPSLRNQKLFKKYKCCNIAQKNDFHPPGTSQFHTVSSSCRATYFYNLSAQKTTRAAVLSGLMSHWPTNRQIKTYLYYTKNECF